MRKVLYVALHEFRRFAGRRGFLFVVFGLPLLMAAVIGVTVIFFTRQAQEPVGVVDRAGVLLSPETVPRRLFDARFVAYPDEQEARAALDAGALQAYLVLEAEYERTGRIALYHVGDPFDGLNGEVRDYLRLSLLSRAGVEPELIGLFADGELDFTFVSLGGDSAANEISAFIFPFVIGFLLVLGVFTTSGMMLQAVVDEKENRTMEILVTSLSPERLMAGKLVGLVGVGLLQLAIWGAFLVAGLLVLRANVPALELFTPSPALIAVAVAWFLPFYLMYAALMAVIGISVTEVSEGQQASGILSLFVAVPFYFMFALISSPDSPFSVALSLIPFSAPLSILIRWPLTAIPAWQLAASWTILAATATAAVLLVGRVLRLGMLRYGQRLTWRQMAGALRRGAAG